MKTTVMTAMMMTLAAAASAQMIVHEHDARAAKEQQLQILMEKSPSTGVHVSIETPAVTGAPYSGEAITESVQVLADGNRIVRRTAAKVYRDGKGRTRRETLGPDGQITSITISDPSGGRSYVIDPGTNTVHHTGVATFVTSESGRVEGTATATSSGGATMHFSTEAKREAEIKAAQHAEQKATQRVEVRAHATGEPGTVSTVGPVTLVWEQASTGVAAAPTKEDLGQQVIEGVTAKGTRMTTVIPAGAIGNELPITVTSEEWVSVDLKVLVMTRHADPRSGETTYRLTGITRGEPNPSLFEAPAGVTVK